MKEEFKQIAAYEGRDIAKAIKRILNDEDFNRWVRRTTGKQISPFIKHLVVGLMSINPKPRKTIDHLLVIPFLNTIAKKSTSSIVLKNDSISHGSAFYITNHRDIILDGAFLSLLLYRDSKTRPYLGVGNNLFARPWIEDLMRINRCFAVIRNGGTRNLMHNAEVLSAYMAELREKGQSFWMAQREGRAKDGNDTTQPSVLKMLTLAEKGDLITALQALNLTPVSITYEFDPCDYLKAQEMQLKRDMPDYKKTGKDDMINMQTGLKGQKGEIIFHVTPNINAELEELRKKTKLNDNGEQVPLSKNELLRAAAAIIDKHIHSGYQLAWTNIAALDILNGKPNQRMEEYIQSRINLIHIDNRDDEFLREKILEMYANPAINYKLAHQASNKL